MYYLSPFRYLLEGLLGVLLHGVQVHCNDSELARFTPPPGQTCQQYTALSIKTLGGYVQEQNGLCEYCQYANGDQYVSLPMRRPYSLSMLM